MSDSRPVSLNVSRSDLGEVDDAKLRRGMIALFDRNAKIEAAARQVVEAWDSQDKPNGPDPVNAIAALREALNA